jgi:hypothetical protein
MKIGLFAIPLLAPVGVLLIALPRAQAATIYGAGPTESVDHFSDLINTHIGGVTESFQLNIFGLEVLGQGSIHGTITAKNLGDGKETFDFAIEQDQILDGVFSLDIPDFTERHRQGLYKIELSSEAHEAFDFTFWNVALGTTPGTEACDILTGTLTTGETWIDETCYDPQEKLQENEEGQRFAIVTSNSGVIVPEEDDAHNPVLAYREPDFAVLEEGTRTKRGENYIVGSSIPEFNYTYGGENCLLGDEQDNIIGINDSCRDENGNLIEISGTIKYDGKGTANDREFEIASAQGKTVGLPEAVPEPSLALGLLTVVGLAGRAKIRSTK